MRFDYLHDPLPPQVEWLATVRVPQRLYAPVIAVCIACVALASTWIVENRRVDAAINTEAQSQTRSDELRARLARFQLTLEETTGLIAFDSRLGMIRSSGYRRARQLADIATALPERAWLTSLTPRTSETEITGRAFDLETIGNVVEHLSGPQFGEAVVQRITSASSASPTQLDFDIILQK